MCPASIMVIEATYYIKGPIKKQEGVMIRPPNTGNCIFFFNYVFGLTEQIEMTSLMWIDFANLFFKDVPFLIKK